MKKTILFFVLLCSIFSVVAQNSVDTTEQSVLKYCTDVVKTAGGAAYSQEVCSQSAAVYFDKNQLGLYANNYVVKMAVGLGKDPKWTPTTVTGFKFWIRKSLSGDNVWEQNFDITKVVFGEWHELVLDSFYAIDGTSSLYFGYTIDCGGLPIGGDGNSLAPNNNAIYIFDVSDNTWIKHQDLGNLNIKVVVAGENMPKNNLAINAVRTASFARTDSKFDAVANILNTLNNEVSSFDFVAYISDSVVYRHEVILDKPLKKDKSVDVFFKDIQLEEEGVFDVVYTIENINKTENDDYEKDSKISVKTYVSNDFEDKVVMLEMFSGTECSNCPAGHRYIHQAIEELGEEKYVWAIHQAGYNVSPDLTLDESYDAVQFFGFESSSLSYAPAGMLDRVYLLDVGTTTNTGLNGPVFSINEVGSRGVLDDYMELIQKNMSPVKLNVTFDLNEETRELNVAVSGELLGGFSDKALRVGVITIEDSIAGVQAGVAGKYKHTHIIRSFLTSAYGTIVPIKDGAFSKEFSEKLKTKFVLDNMRLAVWVGKNGSVSDLKSFEIYQTYEVKLTDRPYTPVEYVSDNTKLVVYQEGDVLYVNGIEIGDVLSVYSMDGKLVMQETADSEKVSFNLNTLTKGAYLLQTNGSYVKFVK